MRYDTAVRPTLLALLATAALAQEFHLKDGDRVVFFGDSITDQRLYTTFTETFTVTRFPGRKITFTHSGWGGDRVTGGAGGGIAERLSRDVFAYQPTVVSIMLGMNDGRVRPYEQQIFDTYANGYRNIIKELKAKAPGVRITAIQPSPYDDVTYEPRFPGGYNAVLLRFADFLGQLAKDQQLTVADLNRPVTAMLAKAKATDPKRSQRIIPDRVHPGPAGHLIMAGGLLAGWSAPSLVSAVTIDAKSQTVTAAANAKVTNLARLSWTQLDSALPFPVEMADPTMALAVNSADFVERFNQQTLKITGLPAGPHTLRIDGSEVATRTAAEWAAGVNLASLRTPMWAQAAEVHALTLRRANVHNTRWRNLQVPLSQDGLAGLAKANEAIDALTAELTAKQRAAAQPVPHQFELVAGPSAFRPLWNGRDLTGWHISQVNHHGNTQGWKVEDGTLTGTQDRPGHGGILLTDRPYKNFEISLEVNPTYGCDGGLFLRANEKGQAYQVLLDYLDGGAIGGIYGERLQGVTTFVPRWQLWYRNADWNHLRARIEGDTPRIRVWLNGILITDFTDTANHLADGATSGMVAVQVHAGNRWVPGGKQRFRNLMIRELPN